MFRNAYNLAEQLFGSCQYRMDAEMIRVAANSTTHLNTKFNDIILARDTHIWQMYISYRRKVKSNSEIKLSRIVINGTSANALNCILFDIHRILFCNTGKRLMQKHI